MNENQYLSGHARREIANIQQVLADLQEHCRCEAVKFDEPKAQALCEATAEVLNSLKTIWEHYKTHAEPAVTP